MRTDGRTDMKLIFVFRDFANAPQSWLQCSDSDSGSIANKQANKHCNSICIAVTRVYVVAFLTTFENRRLISQSSVIQVELLLFFLAVFLICFLLIAASEINLSKLQDLIH